MSSGPKIGWPWVRAARYACAQFAVPAMMFFAAVALDPLSLGLPDANAQTASSKQAAPQSNTSMKDVRRLQRLLKLLATQKPARYASVDPGVIDGTLGRGTIVAIRNFQRIIGVPRKPVITPALYAQILTAQSEAPTPNIPSKRDTRKRNTAATPSAGSRANSGTGRFVQISSLKDEKRIPRAWASLKQMNPELLKGRAPVVETANLGQRGTYYRILVGPFDNFQNANAFCVAWRKQRQSCLVKKPLDMTQLRIEEQKPADAQTQTGPDRTKTTPPMQNPKLAGASNTDKSKTAPARSLALNTPAAASGTPVKKLEPDRPSPHSSPLLPVEQSPIDPVPVISAPPVAAVVSPTNPSAALGSPDAEQPQQQIVADQDASPRPAIAADKTTSADNTAQPAVAPATALVQWMARIDRIAVQSYLGPAIAATAGACFGVLVVVWRQRRRKNLMFESILDDSWVKDGEQGDGKQPPISPPNDILEELKIQFDGADLVESRRIRDAFLESVKEPRESMSRDTGTSEYAMLVNRKLNQMIASDPSKYKSVFLNWIFLNHAAELVESSEYTLKRLDPRIQAEFRLLASLFKIHLLELEARHHVRERLPNIFATLHQLEA